MGNAAGSYGHRTVSSYQAQLARVQAAASKVGRTVQIMEVCGTHTVSLFRHGVRGLLPENLRLISGPGCPVCVTSQGYLDAAIELAEQANVTLCTYGDMVRVPGSRGSLELVRARGMRVEVVYSARDALRYAREHKDEQVMFLAVGFETTAPATAATVLEADAGQVQNFSILVGHKLVLPAMQTLLDAGDVPIDAFLCPGHVSIVIGSDSYRPIAERYGKPCVVAGFEPGQLLSGIASIVEQVASGQSRIENVYGVAVSAEGNPAAKALIERVFQPVDTVWRAMGVLPGSGLGLRDEFTGYDACHRFGVAFGPDVCPPGCLCGEVIQGKASPDQCGLFGTACTPVQPVGPCMVSSEGTCAAWYRYNPPARANRTV